MNPPERRAFPGREVAKVTRSNRNSRLAPRPGSWARAAMAVTNLGLVASLVALAVLTVRGGAPELTAVARDGATRLEIPAAAGAVGGLDPRTWTELAHAAEAPKPVVAVVATPTPAAPVLPRVSVLLAGVDTDAAGAGSCILAVDGVQLALAQGDRLPDGRALVDVQIEGDGDGRAARVVLEAPGGERATFELARRVAR